MSASRGAGIALLAAPAVAVVATLFLVLADAQMGPVLSWGGAMALVSAGPLASPPRLQRPAVWVCAALVLAAVVLAAASVGLYYLPTLAALVVAGSVHPGRVDR